MRVVIPLREPADAVVRLAVLCFFAEGFVPVGRGEASSPEEDAARLVPERKRAADVRPPGVPVPVEVPTGALDVTVVD